MFFYFFLKKPFKKQFLSVIIKIINVYIKECKNMNVYEAIMNRRTIRKFRQEKLKETDITEIINCGRMSAFGANLQPLKYAVIDNDNMLKEIYPLTKWAGYLADWNPAENERPTAYIAVLADTDIKPADKCETDAGAAVTSMMLAAEEKGIGSCWLGAIERSGIKKLLGLDEKYHVLYLLALGYPAQDGKAVDMENDDVHYYFDENGNVCVPKRKLDDVIVKL